jgi:hypothetical protein
LPKSWLSFEGYKERHCKIHVLICKTFSTLFIG